MSFQPTDIMIFLGVLAVLALLFFAVTGAGTSRSLQRRIARVSQPGRNISGGGKNKKTTEEFSLRKKLVSGGVLGRLLSNLPTAEKMHRRLEKTGKKISVEQYLYINAGILGLVTLVIHFGLAKSWALGVFAGIIIGVGVPHFLVNRWINQWMKNFVTLFPDGIDLIVRGLRAGLPVTESIKLVAHEISEPVAGVFGGMADTMRLGVPLEKIMSETAKRLECTEFNFFVTSIILQRETGGNLSEILNNLSDVLRKRIMMRLKIKSMTSEARASTMIIGSLPFLVALAVNFMSPGYMVPMFDDFRGNMAALGGLCSLSLGVFIMNKMANFEI